MNPTAAKIEVSVPNRSKRPAATSREFGTDRRLIAAEARVSTIGNANSHRQVATSTSSADRNMPSTPPPAATADQIPIALERSWSGKEAVITDSVTGMISAAPTPLSIRAASITSTVGARVAAMLAIPNTASPAIKTGLRPHRSPAAPSGSSIAARVSV